ncbi:carboxypeptidase-like regulatory domain-containing protein [Terriglobus sp. YAF25]|uniref:carboxypeptidase-like regulatory domain-containing protein n=1 Tax=Terriglobus sp. YAF25 TaxID=3233080 RepID=UPI003F99DC1E
MRPSKFWLVVVYVCLLSTRAWSQGATTQLRGTVLDPSGATVKGAAVHLVNQANSLAFDTVTSDAGEYTFLQIPPELYLRPVELYGESQWHGLGRALRPDESHAGRCR